MYVYYMHVMARALVSNKRRRTDMSVAVDWDIKQNEIDAHVSSALPLKIIDPMSRRGGLLTLSYLITVTLTAYQEMLAVLHV